MKWEVKREINTKSKFEDIFSIFVFLLEFEFDRCCCWYPTSAINHRNKKILFKFSSFLSDIVSFHINIHVTLKDTKGNNELSKNSNIQLDYSNFIKLANNNTTTCFHFYHIQTLRRFCFSWKTRFGWYPSQLSISMSLMQLDLVQSNIL